MNTFSMNPVPDRQTFITMVVSSLKKIHDNLQYKNTDFAEGVRSCHATLIKYLRSQSHECTLNDIVDCFSKLNKLDYAGAGLLNGQVNEMNELKRYMQDYELSQMVKTNNRKKIPDVYQKQVEGDFVQDTIDFLANLYNKSDQRTQISKSIRECVEIFWEYDVTWQRKADIATRDTILKLKSKINEIEITREYEASEIGIQLRLLKLYIYNWFHYEFQKSTPNIDTQDINTSDNNATDINKRVKQLEEEVQELRSQVQALTIDFSREHLPRLERTTLLKQLARHA